MLARIWVESVNTCLIVCSSFCSAAPFPEKYVAGANVTYQTMSMRLCINDSTAILDCSDLYLGKPFCIQATLRGKTGGDF